MQKKEIIPGKKGLSHDIFFNAFELVLAAIIIIALFSFINDIAKQSIFEKNYVARDLGLLMNSIYLAPGSVEYHYRENTKEHEFYVEFKHSRIEIQDPSAPIFYYFGEDIQKPISPSAVKLDNDGITITKTDIGVEAK